jgi:hypothetical protein
VPIGGSGAPPTSRKARPSTYPVRLSGGAVTATAECKCPGRAPELGWVHQRTRSTDPWAHHFRPGVWRARLEISHGLDTRARAATVGWQQTRPNSWSRPRIGPRRGWPELGRGTAAATGLQTIGPQLREERACPTHALRDGGAWWGLGGLLRDERRADVRRYRRAGWFVRQHAGT